MQYIKQRTEALAQNEHLPTKFKDGLSNVLNSELLKSSTVLQHELNYLGFKIKDYGNERLGNSIMSIDDFAPSKIANFFSDPDTYSNMLEEASRFLYSLVPDEANPWKDGEDYIGRGINEWANLVDTWLEQDVLPYFKEKWDKFEEQFPNLNPENWVDVLPEWAREWLNLNPRRSNKAHGYDPLILNLDGKGIQTLAPSSISARFDHNADGIATATGWTAAGNGILALDLDKNGKIDSGKEIFGNHSVLSNGATAAHGYAALAELDSNHDNLINKVRIFEYKNSNCGQI